MDYFETIKTKFFIIQNIIAIIITSIIFLSDILIPGDNVLISVLSKITALFVLIVSLGLLKFKGIKIAGNIYSIISVITLLIWMNIIPQDISPLFKFIQGFYSIIALFVISSMFASNSYIIIINAIMILASTTHIVLTSIKLDPENSKLLLAGYTYHTISIIFITTILYILNKYSNIATQRAKEEIKKTELRNQELRTSEEEIRAANEELFATTEALKDANTELTEALTKAKESDRLKSEFLNNMSHEIRTPMNGIMGFVQLLDTPDISEDDKKHYISIIQNSSNQLLKVIDNIIEISNLATKQVKIIKTRININKLLHELFSVFKITADEYGIELKLSIPKKNENFYIISDEIKIYKIISNLLENALKFTTKGFIEFGYSIIKKDNNEYIEFFVTDTGIGIPKDKTEIIFKKFQQANSGVAKNYRGLGIGLAIVKENTELLNGEIKVESTVNKGTTFFITIPLSNQE